MLAALLLTLPVYPVQDLVPRSSLTVEPIEFRDIDTRAITLHPAGGAVVAATRFFPLDGPPRNGATVLRVLPDGTVGWRSDFLPPGTVATASTVAVLEDGTVVAGFSGSPSLQSVLLRAYEPSGALRWERVFTAVGPGLFGRAGALGSVGGSDVLLHFEQRRSQEPLVGRAISVRLDGSTGADVWVRDVEIASLGPAGSPLRAQVSGGALYFIERRLDRVGWAIKLDGDGDEVYATPDVLSPSTSDTSDQFMFSVDSVGRVVAGALGQISFLDADGRFLSADTSNSYRQLRWTSSGTVLALRSGAVDAFDAAGSLLWSRPGLNSSVEIAPTAAGGARVLRSLPGALVRVTELDAAGLVVGSVDLPTGGQPLFSVGISDEDAAGRQWCIANTRVLAGPSRTRIVEVAPDSVDGAVVCDPPTPNSTGERGRIAALGNGSAAADDVVLYADQLPPGQTTLFLNSRTPGSLPMVGGGLGTLCLGGAVNRYLGPGEVGPSNDLGIAWLRLTLPTTPDGSTVSPVLAGETWYHQAWHRDLIGGAQTSHLTGAVAVTYR